MSTFLGGKKTYIGIIAIVAGYLGLGDLLSADTIATVIDNVLQIVGIVIAIYGRYAVKK